MRNVRQYALNSKAQYLEQCKKGLSNGYAIERKANNDSNKSPCPCRAVVETIYHYCG